MAGSNMGQVRPAAGPGGNGRRMSAEFARARMGNAGTLPGFDLSRAILHVDVNSAFLSWEAAWRLQHGDRTDLRDIPSVVGGDEQARKGIVLARSLPAKRYGVQTGEPLWQARKKCPGLVVAPPDQQLYTTCSNALAGLLSEYTDRLERYSIDECFLDLTDAVCLKTRTPEGVACEIRDRVRLELGFTVNIGVSVNKLLAKTASELEKPNRVHTLFPAEIPAKLWTLPVRELFLVGPRVAPRLYRLNIFSIGHLAQTDPVLLQRHFKSLGPLLWQFANGFDDAPVRPGSVVPRAIGNSVSTPYDVGQEREALLFLHAVAETASARLREAGLLANVVSVGIRTADLSYASHQRRLPLPTDHTGTLLAMADQLFRELWTGAPLRHVGISLSNLADDRFEQESLFGAPASPQARALDAEIDALRARYGRDSLMRAGFVASGIPPMAGGPQDTPAPGRMQCNDSGPWHPS